MFKQFMLNKVKTPGEITLSSKEIRLFEGKIKSVYLLCGPVGGHWPPVKNHWDR